MAASPLSTSTSTDDPPCNSPPPGDADDTGAVELSDPRFPRAWYADCHELNDNVPWQPNGIPFVPGRTYTPAEQDRVVQSERSIFNATEKWVTEFGVRKKELTIIHPDNPLASSRLPSADVVASELSAPPVATSQRSAESSLRNSFGNNLFGSGYHGTTWLTYARTAIDATMRIQSNANITATVLQVSRNIVNFWVSSEVRCGLGSPPTPPAPPGSSSAGRVSATTTSWVRAWAPVRGLVASVNPE